MSLIYWSCYEGMKRAAGQLEPTVSFSFSAGAVSGMIAGTLTLPFDVVKTHRQIQLGEADLPVLGKTLATTKSIMTQIYNNQGIRGLFKGYVPRVLKVAPACGIMISTYEYGKSFFVNYNKQHSVLQ